MDIAELGDIRATEAKDGALLDGSLIAASAQI
jgi:hypothetical protein